MTAPVGKTPWGFERAVLVEARSMTYGDLGAKALLSVLVVVCH